MQEPHCGEEDGSPGSQVSLFLGQASFLPVPGGRSLACRPDCGRPGLSAGVALSIAPDLELLGMPHVFALGSAASGGPLALGGKEVLGLNEWLIDWANYAQCTSENRF